MTKQASKTSDRRLRELWTAMDQAYTGGPNPNRETVLIPFRPRVLPVTDWIIYEAINKGVYSSKAFQLRITDQITRTQYAIPR